MRRSLPILLCAAVSASAGAGGAGGAFYPLGVTDPESESRSWAASADGTTVVGTDSGRAFRWTAATGKVPLSVEGSEVHSAVGVSADGRIVLGRAFIRTVSRAWLLDFESDEPVGLIVEPLNADPITPWGLSADAGTFVGITRVNGVFTRPFRWTPADGFEVLLGPVLQEAYAVNADGSVTVGGSLPAFVWREEMGPVPLPVPPEYYAYAYAVSADGGVIAGESFDGLLADGIVWVNDEYSILPALPGATYTGAYAVSGDGRLIAGRSSLTGATGYRAAVWDETRRVIDPNAYFDSIGLDRGGLHLTFIRGLSHDGRTLAGWGERDIGDGETILEAWVAVLDRPMSCAADLDDNGGIGFSDLNILLPNFGCVGEACLGDVNRDGRVDFLDLNEILSRYGVRCFDTMPQ